MTATTSTDVVRGRLAGEPVRVRAHGNRHSRRVELHVLAIGRPMLIEIEPENAIALVLEITTAHERATSRRAA